MTAYNGNFYVLDGAQPQMYLLNAASGNWSAPATTCTGPDCIVFRNGSAPADRFGEGMTYSPDDNLIMMAAGETASGGGAFLAQTWTFDPSTYAWTELCGPTMTATCANLNYAISSPGARLVYDTMDHVFIWVDYGGPSVDVYAMGTIAPLNYGRTTNTYNPTPGSLNRQAPGNNNTTQGWASDLSVSSSGSTVTIAHIEGVHPSPGQNCIAHAPNVLSAGAYLPNGAIVTACGAFGLSASLAQEAGNIYTATIGGNLWSVFEKQHVSPYWGEAQSIAFAQAYGSASGLWYPPNFPPQTPVGDPNLSAGSNTVTLSPFPTNIGVGSVVNIKNGNVSEEIASIAAIDNPTITFTTQFAHSGPYTIQDSGWLGCFTVACTVTNWSKYNSSPQGILGVGGVPTVLLIEESKSGSPNEYLYIVQQGSSGWAELGKTALNVAGSSQALSASFDTDGNGNLMACWAELTFAGPKQTTWTSTPQIQCKYWNGSSYTPAMSSSLNMSGSNWAYNPSVKYFGGLYYVAWAERPTTGWTNIYVKACNPTSNSCTLVAPGSLNINTSTGQAFRPRLATDGTSLVVVWEEQAALGQHPVGHLAQLTGSGWSVVGGPLCADCANGSVESIDAAVVFGTVTAAWTEMLAGNLRQVYSAAVMLTVPVVGANSLPGGTVGVPYSQTLTAGGGTPPYANWVLNSGMLPPGLTLNASSGTISGIPASASGSPFQFSAIVKDSAGLTSAPQGFSIAISQPAGLTIVTAASLPLGTVGVSYIQAFAAAGGKSPYRNWSVTAGAIPPGTSFSSFLDPLLTVPAVGLLTGIPTAAGAYSFTVQVTDAGNTTVQQQFSLTINPSGTVSLLANGIANAASYAGGGVAPEKS